MEYEIRVRAKDGKNYLISYSALREKLKIDDRIDYALERILEIEKEIDRSLEPKAQQEILKLIEENPNIRTGDLTDHFKGYSRFIHLAFWHAWNKLQESNQIVATSHGKGKHKTWNIRKD